MTRRALFGLIVLALGLAFARPEPAAQAAAYVFQTDMFGGQQVPPVNTVAYGFVRFFFDESRLNADYTVDVKGLSNSLITGADIHRGARGVNGPVVYHLADGNFIVTSGHLRLSAADLEEMIAGNWYVSLKAVDYPDGALRGQIIVPPDFQPQSAPPLVLLAPPPPAGAQLRLPLVACSTAASVTFSWTPVAGAIVQWVDLSVFDNAFAPDTFWGAGPLTARDGALIWNEVPPNQTYYWRVNALTQNGWLPSAGSGFVACPP